MQTYTHGALGALAGVIFFPHEPMAQVACVAGALAPDGPTAIAYAWFKLKKVPAFANWTSSAWYIEMAHSFVVGVLLIALSFRFGWWAFTPVKAFVLSALMLHVVVDFFTHVSPEYAKTDAGYLWPLPWRLRPSFGWEYRQAKGPDGEHRIGLKPAERNFLVLTLALTVIAYLR